MSLTLTGAILSACATGLSATSDGVIETHEAMGRWINQASGAIWDIRSGARSEMEGLDPALMGDGGWSKLEEASRSLEHHARRMAAARTVRVGAADAQPGFASRSEMQSRIDADPRWFRKLSLEMAEHARDLNAAARARNPRRARDLIESMNETCQTCHTRYWVKSAPQP
jgi:hypothetical protein